MQMYKFMVDMVDRWIKFQMENYKVSEPGLSDYRDYCDLEVPFGHVFNAFGEGLSFFVFSPGTFFITTLLNMLLTVWLETLLRAKSQELNQSFWPPEA
jgi:hypothetical protein